MLASDPGRSETNERSIFSTSTGQVLEVAERRVAGAEVVDRDLYAKRAQRLERPAHAVGLLHERALRDLDRERGRREVGLVERPGHVGDERALEQVEHRHVHGHAELDCRVCRQIPHCRTDSASTKRFRAMTSRVCSASGMNDPGWSIPFVG